MIGCHDVQAARLELAGGGALAPEQSQAVAQHLAGCSACQAFAQEMDAVEAAVQQSLVADAQQATGQHAARFLEAVAREPQRDALASSAVAPRGRRVSDRRPRQATTPFPFRLTGVVAVAAGLALAAGLGLFGDAEPDVSTELQLVRGAEARPYQAGESLRPGDRLQAHAGGAFGLPQAELHPAEGSVLRVERLSPRVVTLERGAVVCDVVPGSGAFQVHTRLGVVSVVGTRFRVALGEALLQVVVERGQVDVSTPSSGERVAVAAGQTAELDANGQVRVSGAAAEQPATPSPQPSVTPPSGGVDPATLPRADGADRVTAKLTNDEHGALYEVHGQVPWVPDGTSLHVNLTTPGMKNELRAAFFKVVCQRGRFVGSFRWPNKRFAPLSYKTTVDLYVGSQPPSLRQQLMRDIGLAAEAQLEVATSVDELGTPSERLAFANESLDRMDSLVERTRALLTLPRDDPRFEDRTLGMQEDLRQVSAAYVILREDDLVHELRNVVADLIEGRGRSLGARLDEVTQEIRTRRPQDFRLPDDR